MFCTSLCFPEYSSFIIHQCNSYSSFKIQPRIWSLRFFTSFLLSIPQGLRLNQCPSFPSPFILWIPQSWFLQTSTYFFLDFSNSQTLVPALSSSILHASASAVCSLPSSSLVHGCDRPSSWKVLTCMTPALCSKWIPSHHVLLRHLRLAQASPRPFQTWPRPATSCLSLSFWIFSLPSSCEPVPSKSLAKATLLPLSLLLSALFS